jgi:CspA family cold shock protein
MAYQDQPPGDGEGTVVNGKVKWFRADKGYGFVTPDDGSPDVFLHVSVLKRLNVQDVPQGSTISCEVVQGQKGRQVSRVIELDTSTATPMPPRQPREGGFDRDARGGAPGRDGPPRWGDRPGGGGGGPGGDRPRFGDRGNRGGDRDGPRFSDRPRRDPR